MIQRPSTLLLLLLLCCASRLPCLGATCLARGPRFQEEADEREDEREDIAERLAEFDRLVKKLHKQREPDPTEVIERIDGFLGEFEDLGPKDRVSMVTSVGAVLAIKRIKNNEAGEPQIRLFYVSVVALGEMGPESVKPLLTALAKKPFQKNSSMTIAIADSLGQVAHPSALKGLVKLLASDELDVLAAGARALGQLQGLDQKARKVLFKSMLKLLLDFRGKVDKDPDDVDAYQDWGIVSGSLLNALGAISGAEVGRLADWEAWWNENRKKTWP